MHLTGNYGENTNWWIFLPLLVHRSNTISRKMDKRIVKIKRDLMKKREIRYYLMLFLCYYFIGGRHGKVCITSKDK